MKKFLMATNNKNKIKEMRDIFGKMNVEVIGLGDIGVDIDVVEDQDTFSGNAMKKAMEIMKATGYCTIADDSGLCVDALNGRPGVFSHRYAGDDAHIGNLKLLKEMNGIPNRKAHFKTSLCYCDTEGNIVIVYGKLDGAITEKEIGSNGFGFDTVFRIDGQGKTLGELSLEEKNQISHRRVAIQNLVQRLKERELL